MDLVADRGDQDAPRVLAGGGRRQAHQAHDGHRQNRGGNSRKDWPLPRSHEPSHESTLLIESHRLTRPRSSWGPAIAAWSPAGKKVARCAPNRSAHLATGKGVTLVDLRSDFSDFGRTAQI